MSQNLYEMYWCPKHHHKSYQNLSAAGAPPPDSDAPLHFLVKWRGSLLLFIRYNYVNTINIIIAVKTASNTISIARISMNYRRSIIFTLTIIPFSSEILIYSFLKLQKLHKNNNYVTQFLTERFFQ